jgi:putative Mg2+ transporter-C (MgtC) family protein
MGAQLTAFFLNGVNEELLIAALLGVLIGVERELAGKDPSIRTFALISMGSCMFAMLSWGTVQQFHFGDPGRIAAQIIPGIGFIGAGTIFRSKHGVSGFTTAALMWVTAGIGMAVGFRKTDMAISATVIAITLTFTLRLLHVAIRRYGPPVPREGEHDDT